MIDGWRHSNTDVATIFCSLLCIQAVQHSVLSISFADFSKQALHMCVVMTLLSHSCKQLFALLQILNHIRQSCARTVISKMVLP